MAAGDADENDSVTSGPAHTEDDSGGSSRLPSRIPTFDDVPLTDEQEAVLQKARDGHNIFFTGPAGTGKSLLLRRIVHHFTAEKKMTGAELVVTAPTGLAAANIGGCTIHSWAGVGLHENRDIEDLLVKAISRRRYNLLGQLPVDVGSSTSVEDIVDPNSTMERWVQCQILIIDEVSMMHANFFDKLEYMARFIRRIDRPFGGIQLVVSGDFLQLPPIVARRDDIKFAFESETWQQCLDNSAILHEVYRQEHRGFIDVLHDLRRGIVTQRVRAFVRRHESSIDYPPGTGPTDLCAKKVAVHSMNEAGLAKLDTPSHKFIAADEPGVDQEDGFMTPTTLELKVGACVMLVRNLVPNMLVNGSLGEVIGFDTAANVHKSEQAWIGIPSALKDLIQAGAIQYGYQHYDEDLQKVLENKRKWPLVRFNYGAAQTVDILCVPLRFRAPRAGDDLFRLQVPLTLTYALTVHKAQGQTLERVRVDMSNMWEYGHFYVALSRVANPDCLEIVNWEYWRVKAHPRAVAWYDELVESLET